MGWGLASSAGIPAMTYGGLSPCRDHTIPTNPGGRVWGWLSDFASHNTTLLVGVVCKVIWVVVVVHSTGHVSPWAADRDPLGQAQELLLKLQSCGAGSASWGKLISTQLKGWVPLRTSSSIIEVSSSITCQSSNTLPAKWQGLLGTSSWAFSTQCWGTFTYARVFCGCASQ